MDQIKSLAHIGTDALYEAHYEAFMDYERSWTKTEFERMLCRRGYVPHLSFGAFTEQDRLVSFTLNGIGRFNGLPTAYDVNTGTIAAFRGKGLASGIFQQLVSVLRAAGIEQYLLEVLQHNTAAVSVYLRQGFSISRELLYFIQDREAIRLPIAPPAHTAQSIELPSTDAVAHMWDFKPSWQNSIESINRAPEYFETVGVLSDGRLAGYGIIERDSGDIPQIAVESSFRRRGIGSAILQALLLRTAVPVVRIINTDAGCAGITALLERNNILCKGRQYEMIRML